MTAAKRKEVKEQLAIVKEILVIALLISAFYAGSTGKRDRAAILNGLAQLKAVAQETQEAVKYASCNTKE